MSPQHPNCEQKILTSLLGEYDGNPPFRNAIAAVLHPPPGTSHLDHARSEFAKAGLGSSEDLRTLPGLPAGRWIVCVHTELPLEIANACDPLLSAAILGLAGPSFYSSARPLVWTQSRLARAITLHHIPQFYEN